MLLRTKLLSSAAAAVAVAGGVTVGAGGVAGADGDFLADAVSALVESTPRAAAHASAGSRYFAPTKIRLLSFWSDGFSAMIADQWTQVNYGFLLHKPEAFSLLSYLSDSRPLYLVERYVPSAVNVPV